MELRARLLAAHSMESFKKYLLDHAKELASDQIPDGANRKASLIALPVQPVGLSVTSSLPWAVCIHNLSCHSASTGHFDKLS